MIKEQKEVWLQVSIFHFPWKWYGFIWFHAIVNTYCQILETSIDIESTILNNTKQDSAQDKNNSSAKMMKMGDGKERDVNAITLESKGVRSETCFILFITMPFWSKLV